MKPPRVPAATISRLSLYARSLEELKNNNVEVISSDKLAEICRVNPAQVRKDLAYFGEFGIRGVGYYVNELIFEVRQILGLNRTWNLALVGMGNLGSALIRYGNFAKRGYIFVAVFDADPHKIGTELSPGLKVYPPGEIIQVCRDLKVDIGVVATPAAQAENMARELVRVPIRAILNFAPVQIEGCHNCMIENVDFSVKLDNLAYHLTSR